MFQKNNNLLLFSLEKEGNHLPEVAYGVGISLYWSVWRNYFSLLLQPYGRGIGGGSCGTLLLPELCVLIEGAGFFHIFIEAGLAWAGTQRLCLSLLMIYDFNPIYGHLQECWTGCKSVKDHKILMRTAEIIWVSFLSTQSSQMRAGRCSPPIKPTSKWWGVWVRCSALQEEKVKAIDSCVLRAYRSQMSHCLGSTTVITAAL